MKLTLIFCFFSSLSTQAGTLKTYLGISSEKYQPKNPSFYCVPVNIVFEEDIKYLKKLDQAHFLTSVNVKSMKVLKWPNMGHVQQPLLFKTDVMQLITSIQSRKFEKTDMQEVTDERVQGAKKLKLVFGKFSKLNFYYSNYKNESRLEKLRIQLGSEEFLYDFYLNNICQSF